MYQVLYNPERSPVDIEKWLNNEFAGGRKLFACNGDFYIFEVVEDTAPECPVCHGHKTIVINGTTVDCATCDATGVLLD